MICSVRASSSICLQSCLTLLSLSTSPTPMDDLTASHWDDVLSPSKQFSPPKFPSLSSGFAAIDLNPHADDNSDDDSEAALGDQTNDQTHHSFHSLFQAPVGLAQEPVPLSADYGQPSVFNQAEIDQLSELKKEERKEHTSQLLSELTSGAETLSLEPPSAQKLGVADSLFNDKGSVSLGATGASALGADNSTPEVITSPSKSSLLKNSQFKANRKRKYALLAVLKHLRGQQGLEDSDPLGPLGGSAEQSDPISNDATKKSNSLVEAADAPLYNISPESEDSRMERLGAPVKPSIATKDRDQIGADGNVFEITVGNPVKVGDIATAHIVYAIQTKNKNPASIHFPSGSETVSVSRRYRDFRWIYRQLQNNHPGKIVPPPPTKQTYIGRFNENFIENRRLSLEKMLLKTSKIPVFANDPDFVMFLTSEDFAALSKEREQISGVAPLNDNDDDASASSNPAVATGTASSGFMSSFFSMSTKVQEPDSFFSQKKSYIEDLEHNLKTFYKSLELIANQRADIVVVIEEIASTMNDLAELDISKVTVELLGAFAEVHIKLKENLERVNLQDQLTLGFTIEEYLRIIGSIKHVFETRTNIYSQLTQQNQELQKKQEALDKLNVKYKSSEEKRNMLTFETEKLKQKVAHFEKSFETITQTIKEELEVFEIDKIEDFRNSVEIFIESSIESQKEAIELWETFYERQHLDKI